MCPVSGAESTPVVKFEGTVSTLTVVKPLSCDLELLRRAVRDKVGAMPDFFKDAPVALDLSLLEGTDVDADSTADSRELAPLSLEQLVELLRRENLRPLFVRELRRARVAQAEALGLAPLGPAGAVRSPSVPSASAPVEPQARAKGAADAQVNPARAAGGPSTASGSRRGVGGRGALILEQPVRGGQVVYAERADAIALASVNSGGELIADGHIHVYGALRGRALAGALGAREARIFCLSLEAELVSIAGSYLRADELPEEHRKRPAQIYLAGEALVVAALPGA